MPGRSSVPCSSTSISAVVVRVTGVQERRDTRDLGAERRLGRHVADDAHGRARLDVAEHPLRERDRHAHRIRVADHEQRRARRGELPHLGGTAADDTRDRRADRRLAERAAPLLDQRRRLPKLRLHQEQLRLRGQCFGLRGLELGGTAQIARDDGLHALQRSLRPRGIGFGLLHARFGHAETRLRLAQLFLELGRPQPHERRAGFDSIAVVDEHLDDAPRNFGIDLRLIARQDGSRKPLLERQRPLPDLHGLDGRNFLLVVSPVAVRRGIARREQQRGRPCCELADAYLHSRRRSLYGLRGPCAASARRAGAACHAWIVRDMRGAPRPSRTLL